MTTFGRKIDRRQIELGKTDTQLADELGFSVQRLSQLKRQEAENVSSKTICRMAVALELDPVFLLP